MIQREVVNMAIRRKKKRNIKLSTRDLIVQEAENLITKHGIDGLVLDEIAENLGIRRPSIYTHFGGRDGILAAVAERAFSNLGEQFQIDSSKSPTSQIKNGVLQLVRFLRENPAYDRLIMRDAATPGGMSALNKVLGFPEDVKNPGLMAPLFKSINQIIKSGVKDGSFRKMDSQFFFNVLLGAIIVDQTHPRRHLKNLETEMVDLTLRILAK